MSRGFIRKTALALAVFSCLILGLTLLMQGPRGVVQAIRDYDCNHLDSRIGLLLGANSSTDWKHLEHVDLQFGDYGWLEDHGGGPITVLHRLGGDSPKTENTLEALQAGLEAGESLFEVDLMETAEGAIVCHHPKSGDAHTPRTLAEFQSLATANGVALCTLEGLFETMATHPDLRLIIDDKTPAAPGAIYAPLRRAALESGLSNRLIPQLYNFNQLASIEGLSDFAGPIFTDYLSCLSTPSALERANSFGVKAVTLSLHNKDGWPAAFEDSPAVLVHPVTSQVDIGALAARGVDGFYRRLDPGQ